MSFIKYTLWFVMMFSTAIVYAEESELDKLLLEMDSLAEEVDGMKLGAEISETEAKVEPKKLSKDLSKTKEISASSDAADDKSANAETEIIKGSSKKEKAENIAVTKLKKEKVSSRQVEKTVKINKEKKPQSQALESADDGFGDFKVVISKENSLQSLRGRDPFAPSDSMVLKYKGQIKTKNDSLELAKLERLKKIEAQKKAIEDERKAKIKAEELKAEMEAKLIQARALALPKMKLKGFIRKPNQVVLALLDVTGHGIHIVRKGDSVSLGGKGMIKIVDINNMSLTIESGEVESRIVVR